MRVRVFFVFASALVFCVLGSGFAQQVDPDSQGSFGDDVNQLKDALKQQVKQRAAERSRQVTKTVSDYFGDSISEQRAQIFAGLLDDAGHVVDNIIVPEGFIIKREVLDYLANADACLPQQIESLPGAGDDDQTYYKALHLLLRWYPQPIDDQSVTTALAIVNYKKLESEDIQLMRDQIAFYPLDQDTLDALRESLQRSHPEAFGFTAHTLVGDLLARFDAGFARPGFSPERLSKSRQVFAEVAAHINPALSVGESQQYIDTAIAQNPKDLPQLGVLAYGANLFDDAVVFGQYDVVQMLKPGFAHLSRDAAGYLDQGFEFMDREFGIKNNGSQSFGKMEATYFEGFADKGERVNRSLSGLRVGMSLGYGEYANAPLARNAFIGRLENQYKDSFYTARRDVGFKLQDSTRSSGVGRGPAGHMPVDIGASYIPSRWEHNWHRIGSAALFGFNIASTVADNTADAVKSVHNPLEVFKIITYDMTTDLIDDAKLGGDQVRALRKEGDRVDAWEKLMNSDDQQPQQAAPDTNDDAQEDNSRRPAIDHDPSVTGDGLASVPSQPAPGQPIDNPSNTPMWPRMTDLIKTVNPEYAEPQFTPPPAELARQLALKFLENVRLKPGEEVDQQPISAEQVQVKLAVAQMSLVYPINPELQVETRASGGAYKGEGWTDPPPPPIE